jgi:hypothetical protein
MWSVHIDSRTFSKTSLSFKLYLTCPYHNIQERLSGPKANVRQVTSNIVTLLRHSSQSRPHGVAAWHSLFRAIFASFTGKFFLLFQLAHSYYSKKVRTEGKLSKLAKPLMEPLLCMFYYITSNTTENVLYRSNSQRSRQWVKNIMNMASKIICKTSKF